MRNLLQLLLLTLYGCNQTVVVGGLPPEPPSFEDDIEPTHNSPTETRNTECTFFVSSIERGNGTGNSWDNATSELSPILEHAGDQLASGECTEVEIRVSAGTYTPDPIERTKSFVLFGGITLRGGYQGNESAPNNRDLSAFVTTLSGEIGNPQDLSDNSYHVLRLENEGDQETRLDGLVIRSGTANGSGIDAKGGGIYTEKSKLRLVDVQVQHNQATSSGAGVFSIDGSLALERVDFTSNISEENGGGVFASNSYLSLFGGQWVGNVSNKGGGIYTAECPALTIEGATFISNDADEGGGLYERLSQVVLLNRLTFTANQANTLGGGIAINNTSNPIVGNSQWVENVSPSGSAIHLTNVVQAQLLNSTLTANNPQSLGPAIALKEAATLRLVNSILWNNGEEFAVEIGPLENKVTASHCIVSSGPTGTNVINNDPLFIQPPNAGVFDLGLSVGSPAINAGTTDNVPLEVMTSDCAARQRLVGSAVDMGAFERQD